MIKDELSEETGGAKVIEALIGDDKTKVWILVMATSLYIVGIDQKLSEVHAVRVRDLKGGE